MITYEQSFTLPENQFEEVIQGESRIMPPTRRGHDRLLRRLEALLVAQLGGRYDVVGPGVGLGITKQPFTYRIPDKMVFPAGVDPRMDNDIYIWESPLLIVECLSPANRKGPVTELCDDYCRIGTREIWLLDPDQRSCEVYRQGRFAFALTTPDAVAVFEPQHAMIPLMALWTAFEGPEQHQAR